MREGVPLKHRLAAIAKRLDGTQAAYFPKPDGHDIAVVSGFVSRRAWIAEAMGVEQAGLLAAFRRAAENPLPWREVAPESAPCRQVVHRFGEGAAMRATCTPCCRSRPTASMTTVPTSRPAW